MRKLFTSMIILLGSFFIFGLTPIYAQLKGKIVDEKNQPIQDVSVHIANTFQGTVSNRDGLFQLDVENTTRGVLVFTFLGYQTQSRTFQGNSGAFQVQLLPEIVRLQEVTLNANENPANAIIRAAQKERKKYLEASKIYTADFYSRGLFSMDDVPERFLGTEIGDFDGALDSTRSGILYLSETKSKIFSDRKDFKEIVYASKISGNDNGFSFNTAEDADFNIYANTISLGNSLASPIGVGAFSYYRFTLEDTFYTPEGKLINRIAIHPKTETAPAFEGLIYIVDEEWSVYGIDLKVEGKRTKLPGLNSLQLKQQYHYNASTQQWHKANQVMDFSFGLFGFNGNGRFSAVYSNYDTSPEFATKTFGRALQIFETAANKKSEAYWSSFRPIPLLEEEIKDYAKKDSLQILRKSEVYLDSIDKENNRLKWGDLVQKSIQNSKKDSKLNIQFPLARVAFNPIQGGVVGLGVNWRRNWEEEKATASFSITNDYGLSDEKHYPKLSAFYRLNSINYSSIRFIIGRELMQFNNRPAINNTINTFVNLWNKKHYARYFQNERLQINWEGYLLKGFFSSYTIGYHQRTPRSNTSQFSIRFRERDYPENIPLANSYDFVNHKMLYQSLFLRYSFGFKFYQEPKQRLYDFDSKYPTLRLRLTKGSNSDVERYNFMKLDLYWSQRLDFGTVGSTVYTLHTGSFLEKNKPSFVDLQHFNGNATAYMNNSYRAFNLLPYYQRSTSNDYMTLHLEHNFYKWGIGSWPLIKQLQASLITGFHGLAIAGEKPYGEFNIGLGNIGIGKVRGISVTYVRALGAVDRPDGVLFGFRL